MKQNIQNLIYVKKNILSLFSFKIILIIKLIIDKINLKMKKLIEHFKAMIKDVKKVYQNETCFLLLNKTVNEEIILLNNNAS